MVVIKCLTFLSEIQEFLFTNANFKVADHILYQITCFQINRIVNQLLLNYCKDHSISNSIVLKKDILILINIIATFC